MNKTKGKRNTKKIGPIESSIKTGKKGDSGSSTMNSRM
jgi:phosphopantothenoylcysteine synthetase/decarboxylase